MLLGHERRAQVPELGARSFRTVEHSPTVSRRCDITFLSPRTTKTVATGEKNEELGRYCAAVVGQHLDRLVDVLFGVLDRDGPLLLFAGSLVDAPIDDPVPVSVEDRIVDL